MVRRFIQKLYQHGSSTLTEASTDGKKTKTSRYHGVSQSPRWSKRFKGQTF